MGFFLFPDLHPFIVVMLSCYSVMGAHRNLIVEILPLSVLTVESEHSVSLFCVSAVLQRKYYSCHVRQFLHLDGQEREWTYQSMPDFMRYIQRRFIAPYFFFPHVLISFFLAYASIFLCATRVTDLCTPRMCTLDCTSISCRIRRIILFLDPFS